MKYYTKEWYNTLQREKLLSCKPIADGDCNSENTERIYQSELNKFYDSERLLAEYQERPFIEKASKKKFDEDLNKSRIPRAKALFPKWVADAVDERLLAFGYLPESIFVPFREELQAEIMTSEQRIAEGKRVLEAQDIPEDIRKFFNFTGSFVLATRRSGRNYRLYVENINNNSPAHVKITFKNIFSVDREKGLRIRASESKDGFFYSNCEYLHDEIYRTDRGYEVHFLFHTYWGLRYLTIECEDIIFDGEFELRKVLKIK